MKSHYSRAFNGNIIVEAEVKEAITELISALDSISESIIRISAGEDEFQMAGFSDKGRKELNMLIGKYKQYTNKDSDDD